MAEWKSSTYSQKVVDIGKGPNPNKGKEKNERWLKCEMAKLKEQLLLRTGRAAYGTFVGQFTDLVERWREQLGSDAAQLMHGIPPKAPKVPTEPA